MRPDVSVICNTFRPGGIDIFLAGMRDQTYPKDRFEVILIDHRYEKRHAEVMALAREYGVNLIHAPEHRRNGKWAVCASGYNTGFALARGRIILMLVDWTYAPPMWIETHLNHHTGNRCYVIGPYIYHAVGITEEMYRVLSQTGPTRVSPPWSEFTRQPKLRIGHDLVLLPDNHGSASSPEEALTLQDGVFGEITAFADGLFDPVWLARMPPFPIGDAAARNIPYPCVVAPGLAHLKNESVARDVVYAINGADTWAERGGRMPMDSEFELRVAAINLPSVWSPDTIVHCVNPRHAVARAMPCSSDSERVDGRWSQRDCMEFLARRKREIAAKEHIYAPAPYRMVDLAKKLDPWRTADTINVSGLDVPDLEFYGREIWPDSPYT